MKITHKTINRVNGGIAIYYGIGSLMGSVSGAVGTIVWLYQSSTGAKEFSWSTLSGLVIITIVMGIIGYAITRVGYEQMNK